MDSNDTTNAKENEMKYTLSYGPEYTCTIFDAAGKEIETTTIHASAYYAMAEARAIIERLLGR